MSTPHDPSQPQRPRFSEAQLRDALRGAPSGDGSLDPGALIGRARAKRARRRGGVLAAGLVAAVIAVSVGVVGTDGGNGSLTSAGQLERGDNAGGSADDDRDSTTDGGGNMPYAPAPPTGGPGDTQLSQAPGEVTPSDPYADRPPITGTGCPAERTDPLPQPTGPGSTGPLLGFAPERAYACVYLVDGAAVATELGGSQIADALASLSTGAPFSADTACTSDFGPSVRLLITGAGQSATIDAESYGCGIVTNGTASRQARAQVAALLAQLDDDLRPLG